MGELLFPQKCPFCHRLWREPTPCPACQESLPWLTEGRALSSAEFVPKIASALKYQGTVRRCIHQLKFHRRVAALPTLALLAGQCARDNFAGQVDVVTWVPLSPKSLRQRGFDQSQELAAGVGEALGLVPVPLFSKTNRRARQSTLKEPAARRANVSGAFTLENSALVAGKRVLVVDDIVTTGATLSECARLLLMAGSVEVSGLCLARASS